MKKLENTKKNNIFKRIFIKFCRLIGFEIIDQSSLSSPTLSKNLNESLDYAFKKGFKFKGSLVLLSCLPCFFITCAHIYAKRWSTVARDKSKIIFIAFCII